MDDKVSNYYELLGVGHEASFSEIKKAFREKAKKLHPDIAGSSNSEAMRKLLSAYETLSSPGRRFKYDKVYSRFVKKSGFNYRVWLEEQNDPSCQAKLILLDLLHLDEEQAISVWRKNGSLNFQLEKFMERGDWMDCQYILAEELDKRGCSYEAFELMTAVLAEERRHPYFKIFTVEIENYLKDIVKNRLKSKVDGKTWLNCMEKMIRLGFSARDEKRYRHLFNKAAEKYRTCMTT